MKVKVVFSIDKLFEPWPWWVRDVLPITDNDGELLAYLETDNQPRRFCDSLPTEIFNHEMKSLDVGDPEAFAAFMSDFGILGKFDSPNGMTEDDAVLHLCETMKSDFVSTDTILDYAARLDSALGDYRDRVHANELRIVTPTAAGNAFRDLMDAAALVKAFMVSDDPEVVSSLIWHDLPCHGIWNPDIAEWTLESLNRYLVGLSPQLGYTEIIDGKTSSPSFKYSHAGSGCFEQAAALQIWGFALEGCTSGYRECTRCGNIFVKKRSKAKNPRTPSSNHDAFCCDKCKSAYHSQKHRRTEGYRLKKEKQSEQADPPERA